MTWPEDWASAWIDGVIRTGCLHDLDEGGAVELVRSMRALLDDLAVPDGSISASGVMPRRARVDLATRICRRRSTNAASPSTRSSSSPAS